MNFSDNHVHSYFSTDSEASFESIIESALEKKLSSVCFTDHMDYDFPSETEEPEFVFDPDSYFARLQKLQKKYTDFPIRIGVELGLKQGVRKSALELTESYPFDFVIGSTHLIDNMDPYEEAYWKTNGEAKGISRYYETTLENIKQGFDYDVYGHIDYVLRYAPTIRHGKNDPQKKEAFINRSMSENEELLREIFREIIKHGKGIEINTAGFTKGLGHPNPHETLLACYKELGGEIITMGSDAHEATYLGSHFEKAYAILKKSGFSQYTEFHQRKPKMISFKQRIK